MAWRSEGYPDHVGETAHISKAASGRETAKERARSDTALSQTAVHRECLSDPLRNMQRLKEVAIRPGVYKACSPASAVLRCSGQGRQQY